MDGVARHLFIGALVRSEVVASAGELRTKPSAAELLGRRRKIAAKMVYKYAEKCIAVVVQNGPIQKWTKAEHFSFF